MARMKGGKAPDIIVLGGGSAGWITAALLHHAWADKGASVTLVESPAIGIIGVGEGSTPQLKAFFDLLGIDETEWMPVCDATYKLGIRFSGWSARSGFESYFHPFPGPTDLHTQPAFEQVCAAQRRGYEAGAHPDRWFLATRLADEAKAPQAGENFPFAPSYGYHFDAHKLGAFLREWCVSRGVVHREAQVADVEVAAGEVQALVCDDGTRIGGDLFVDCSGFRAVIAEALGSEFQSYGENLFADRAVVMPTPRDGTRIVPATGAIAMRAGWRWSIPLTVRTGNGYVYSSAHISDDEAAAELARECGGDAEPRFLKMRVGRMRESWRGNCLVAGLSQGFIEPLEATALHIVIHTALEFIQAHEQGGFTARHRDAFNASISERYDGIRDYIVAHYRLNRRDGDYWRANAANDAISDRLKAMMTAWFTHRDIAAANRELYPKEYYSSASWHCLFAGYGSFPPPEKMQPLPADAPLADPARIDAMLAACARNFGEYAS
ncbi:tryptophan 7-halogenase [Alteriqipengyuania flavescens]|uniref:tryptophan halogenase family protein n=1 Tax=Alteriqipengyuania flavescens TaxID=3053610 RepID=UPI0025B3780C|nr:tryptophan halogenase family protein [Alteriqipengyuania flavescens]WJY19975.1 tryptophan 7-halogenase [Alteriqipengyuania flavescens]WJY24987.1 tryptophan 7-halogenase [Alteriqipengyuania flavescens]